MLTIYLHRSQQALLDELKGVCPDLAPAERSVYPNYTTYRSYLLEEDRGRRQKGWLSVHHVLFVDTERQRERRARAFLDGVVLAPEDVESPSFSFARVDNDPDFHRMTASTRRQAATFYLQSGWTGREHTPFHLWVGAIYVCRQEGDLVISGFNAQGCLDHEVARLLTEEELTQWLLDRRYLQIYCFSPAPDLCGLYLYLHDDGLPEALRLDE